MAGYCQSAKEYVDRGIEKEDLGDYRGAILEYNNAVNVDQNYRWAYYNRANAKANLHDYRGAIADCNKAIELYPNYEKAFEARGDAKDDLNDFTGAIRDYTKVIEMNPSRAMMHRFSECNWWLFSGNTIFL